MTHPEYLHGACDAYNRVAREMKNDAEDAMRDGDTKYADFAEGFADLFRLWADEIRKRRERND